MNRHQKYINRPKAWAKLCDRPFLEEFRYGDTTAEHGREENPFQFHVSTLLQVPATLKPVTKLKT